MPAGRCRLRPVSGEGSPPPVLAIVKLKPTVVLAPSLLGEKDVWSTTVCAAPAVAGRQQQINRAAVTALVLDKRLIRPSGGHAAAQVHGDSATQTLDRAAEAQPDRKSTRLNSSHLVLS